ncbi:MAG: phosphomethylpyrimidine synthase ThiC [bacterium]
MLTQLEQAKQGIITDEMKQIALEENVCVEELKEKVAQGKIVILYRQNKKIKPVGIGKGLRTKINASIGTSTDLINLEMEIEKAKIAENYKADTLMELSVGGDLDKIRKEIISISNLPVGNVPLYQAFSEAIEKYGSVVKLEEKELFDIIEKQCADGLSFMAIHCGINQVVLERLRNQGYRYGGLVSKGGASMVAWMVHNQKENPLYEKFEKVVEILKKYDVILSLGNGLRAGSIMDSTDRAQIQELVINCELACYAKEMGVQTMVEGPGHIPLNEIEANVILEKCLSKDAPFYMLGPLPTDISIPYDHISSSIGASLSSAYGADFICYVTPSEHLGLPYPEDVKTGVIAARIAAHIGDIVKNGNIEQDMQMSKARRDRDWEKQYELAIDKKEAKEFRLNRPNSDDSTCTMCGKFCATKIANSYFICDK